MTRLLKQIEDRYEILQPLGEGGMGAIYKVRHRLLDDVRVVKVMRSQHESNPDLQARFLREAKAAVSLKHPNIAQVHDFWLDPSGTAFLVMEYIEGQNLEELLESGVPALGLALEISRQSLRALGYLHTKQFVHRDVSPDNLMLTKNVDGQPLIKLIDLGIAKELENEEAVTKTGLFVGKVAYASPEQFGTGSEDAAIDGRSDIYSFGIVLYQLVTGHFPIEGDEAHSIIAGHLFRPPLGFDRSDSRGRVPEWLRSAILRALEKAPTDRFQDAAAFLAALDHPTEEPADAGVTAVLEPVEWQRTIAAAGPAPTVVVDPKADRVEQLLVEAALAEITASVRRLLEEGRLEEAAAVLHRGEGEYGEVNSLLFLKVRLEKQQQRRDEIGERLEAARRLVEERRFEDASELIDRVRELDPAHEEARRLFDLLAETRERERVEVREKAVQLELEKESMTQTVETAMTSVAGARVTVVPTGTRGRPVPALRRGPMVWVGSALVVAMVLGIVVLRPDPVPPVAPGRLALDAVPWGEVVAIEGEAGPIALPADPVTPLVLELAPGRYEITVQNPELGEERTRATEVVSGRAAELMIELADVDVDEYFDRVRPPG